MSGKTDDTLKATTSKAIDVKTPPLALDASEYAEDLMQLGLTEAQGHELLETLWSIMWSFVELGFEVDILQLFVPDKDSDGVDCDDTPSKDPTSTANGKESVP